MRSMSSRMSGFTTICAPTPREVRSSARPRARAESHLRAGRAITDFSVERYESRLHELDARLRGGTPFVAHSTRHLISARRDGMEEDDNVVTVIAHVDERVVGTGSLGIGDAMGQVHVGESIWRRAQGHIGYTIDPAHAGRRHATHLARALLAIAFDDLGLHRVTAGCFADNTPSWRALEARDAAGAARRQGLVARRARLARWLHLRDPAGGVGRAGPSPPGA